MATAANPSAKRLSIMSIALMTSAAVISLRGLPMMAREEMTMFFYIGFATVLFLIPAALVSAELGSAFSTRDTGLFQLEGGKVHPLFRPQFNNFGNIAFLAGIILLFAGVEVHAVHANEMANPKTEFPLAMLIAALIIFVLFTPGSLGIAAVMPAEEIELQSGLMAASQIMLDKMGFDGWNRLFCLLLALGLWGA